MKTKIRKGDTVRWLTGGGTEHHTGTAIKVRGGSVVVVDSETSEEFEFPAERFLPPLVKRPGDSLEGMARTADRGPGAPEGWPICDVERRNDDPWVCDDNWHRGEYTVYTLRGTNIREESKAYPGEFDDLFDRFMRRVRAAGYVGLIEFVRNPVEYPRTLHSNVSY